MIAFHIGKIGDTIACMHFFAQQYRLTGQKTQYYYKRNRFFTDQDYQFMKPLLDVQPWISKHGIYDKAEWIPQQTTLSLANSRDLKEKYNFYDSQYEAQRWWQQQAGIKHQTDQLRTRLQKAYNVSYDKTYPFLTVPEKKLIDEPYIVIYCTGRYHCFTDYSPLDALPYKKIFIGKPQEYQQFGKKYEYYKVKDALQAAQLMKGSKLVVGGQSAFQWLAQGLGVNRILIASQSWGTGTPQVLSDVMLRVTRVQQLKKAVDIMLKKIKVGYAITTYGTPAYVQLQIKQHKKWDHDIIVVDDGSHDQKLKEVCSKYGVPLLNCDNVSKGHQYGDWYSTVTAIQYFKNYDYMVKISRRCLWLHDKGLSIAAYQDFHLLTDWWVPYQTYGHKALHTGCIVYNIKDMYYQLFDDMKRCVPNRNKYVQRCLYTIYSKYCTTTPFITWRHVYVKQGRQLFPRDILWKTSSVQEYKKLIDGYDPSSFIIKED